MSVGTSPTVKTGGPGLVLATLATGQFLMALDTSVMNVSIATVAVDVGTTVTGIQTAITLYTLVMASLMITGGRIGQMIGRKRAFTIGAVIYGAGSLTTAIAPNLTVLILGWSFLEGIGAALILPAIVGLVAGNFVAEERTRAYGLIAAAMAAAVAVGPVLGGFMTTYASWRWVFAGEVVLVVAILVLSRFVRDQVTTETPGTFDGAGAFLSATGLAAIVLGILRSSAWGLVRPVEGGPSLFGLSPAILLVVGGLAVLGGFLVWEEHRIRTGRGALVDPKLLRSPMLRSGLLAFFFQFLVQAGLFFCVPLFLSVALGLPAVETGLRVLPLSVALVIAALGIPRLFPAASPRRVARLGFAAIAAGTVALMVSLEAGAGAEVVTVPLLLAGLGVGALASQLGAVTVSAVPDEESAAVGGLQNTVTNLGASIGTAVAGTILIATLTTALFTDLQADPAVPKDFVTAVETRLDRGVPFASDAQVRSALAAEGVPEATIEATVESNAEARLVGLRSALAVLAVLALLAIAGTGGLPTAPLTAGRP
ncbi:MAG: MFS transporter [Actinomycetota bacterium]